MTKRLRKRLLNSRAVLWLAATLVAAYIRFVYYTTRWDVRPETLIPEQYKQHAPLICCFWHSHLLLTIKIWRRKYGRIFVMISHHRDGEFIADVCSRFGIEAVRGSSRKGAVGAFRSAWKILREGHNLAITPDGPRGPRHQAQPGAVALAKASGAAIIPMSCAFSHRHLFPSWDKFMMPLPFGRGHFVMDAPMLVPRDATEEEMAALTEKLEHTLNLLTAEAEAAVSPAALAPHGARSSLAYPFYRNATQLAAPFITLYLRRRCRKGKEDAQRLGERFGYATAARPRGPLVWLHAASVGESLSVLPLAERILAEHPALSLLLTTGTVTSAALMQQRLPPRALHQFVPVDQPDAVGRFLDHWQPELALFVESELWPNLVLDTRARGCPLLLINARMSERSFGFWKRFPGLARQLTGAFALVLAQSEGDAERLRRLGAERAEQAGNLKFDTPPLPADGEERAKLRRDMQGRPLWLAASTHPGEEEQVAAAHRQLRAKIENALLILVPRHASRGGDIAALLRERGFDVACRSRGEAVTPQTDIYLADSMGELGLWYRLADVTFMGGTLVPHGGQNPLEPARLHSALIFGPHMENFADIAQALERAQAVLRVTDAASLASQVQTLLQDAPRRKRIADAAEAEVRRKQGALAKILERLQPYLLDLSGREGSMPRETPPTAPKEKRIPA